MVFAKRTGERKARSLARWALPSTLLLTALAACSAGVDVNGPGNGHYGDGDPDPDTHPGSDLPPALQQGLVAGPPMARGLSNREYLHTVSDLIGAQLSPGLQATWMPTPQFSGFDSVPWTNYDTKAIRDRLDTLDGILDVAVEAPKLMVCSAASDADLAYEICAKRILEPFATRAFGRPLRGEEATALGTAYGNGLTLARTVFNDPPTLFKEALRVALGSVLLAPQLLTRMENANSAGLTGERALDAYEVADRLSFLMIGSIPDDELWAKAQDGTLLSDPAQLAAQVNRLLDTHTDAFVDSFMGQWFDFRAYENAAPDSLEAGLWNETARTLVDVIKNDLPVTAILAPGFTYVNQQVATHYGLPGTFGADFQKITTTERGGILQQGSWLTLSASPQGTKPIHRGRLLQDRLLCKAVSPPSSELFAQIQATSAMIPSTATVKERLEQHRSNPACSSCHQYMDPIGLGLEGFDQYGKVRTVYADTNYPVETDTFIFDKAFSTVPELNAILASMPEYRRCASEKIAIYSLKRVVHGAEGSDKAILDALSFEAEGKVPSFRQIVLRLVQSNAFLKVNHGAQNGS